MVRSIPVVVLDVAVGETVVRTLWGRRRGRGRSRAVVSRVGAATATSLAEPQRHPAVGAASAAG